MRKFILGLALLIGSATAAEAHLSWIRLPDGPLAPGRATVLSLDHGDVFPESAGSLPLDYTRAFATGPEGESVELELREEGNSLVAGFTPNTNGVHRFHYIYHPGVMSKTTEGWKIGGADQYPLAYDRLRGIQTAVGYVFGAGGPPDRFSPVGLDIEMVPRIVGDSLHLTLLKDGRPYAGAEILYLPTGQEAHGIGTTDDEGTIDFVPAGGLAGELAFGVKIKLPMPEDSEFDRDVFFTTLCLDFRGTEAEAGD